MNCKLRKKGFTLVEVLVALSIFLVIIGLVSIFLVQVFRSFRQGQELSARQTKQRMCLFRMSKDIASLVKVLYPPEDYAFSANDQEFFFIFAQESSLAESRYKCDLANQTLEHYYQESTDYDENTYQKKEVCLEDLVDCSFSYSDGSGWKSNWSQTEERLPQLIKITFRYKADTQPKEFIINIPVSP